MRSSRIAAIGLAFLLVLFQIFSFDWRSFALEGYDDVLGADEDEEQEQQAAVQSYQSQRRQNVLEEEDFDIGAEEEAKENVERTERAPEEEAKQEETTTTTTANEGGTDDSSPLTCHTTQSITECCASWDVNADYWWTQHPHWEISLENETSYCFRPIQNQPQVDFLLKLHDLQWNALEDPDHCDSLLKSVEQNSGFGASTDWLIQSLFYAYKATKSFQIAHNGRPWLYSVQQPDDHWAYCQEQDSRCYYLPISSCTNRTETIRDEHYRLKPSKTNRQQENLEFQWMRHYLYRPKTVFRRKLYETRRELMLGETCTAMHIRRGDVGYPRTPYRRYAAVQEYIDAARHLRKGDTIFLLTDDESTIEEVQKYHADDYHWVYFQRPRNRGIEGGFDGHIPSGDPALEMLIIDSELRLAKQCRQLVYGQSGFMKSLLETMDLEGRPYQHYPIDTEVTEEETKRRFARQKEKRVATFFRDIDELYVKKGKVPVPLTTWNGDLPPPSDMELKAAESAVTCVGQEECCGTWNVNADAWWLHHPDYQIATENETHFCFAPIPNATEREFMRTLHDHQWGGDCSQVEKTVVVNSGFGSSTGWDQVSFFHAWKQKKQFQLIHGGRVWLYATTNRSSWAYCESKDSRCYFLPVGRCSRNETIRGEHHDQRPKKGEEHIFHWLKKYLTRPNQQFRRKTYEMKQLINLQTPCVTIHVRRGDAGFPTTPYRRYAAVLEYLDAGNVEEGANVFLMTDDDSTLEEVQKHLKDKYNWMYFDKPRNNGISAGFDGHIPSGDHGHEMVVIASEKHLASTCSKLVYGKSGFINSLMEDMEMDGKNFTKYLLDTEVTKQEARKYKADQDGRIKKFLSDIEEFYQKRAQGGDGKPSEESAAVTIQVNSLESSLKAPRKEQPKPPTSSTKAPPETKPEPPANASPATTEDPDAEHAPLECRTTAEGKECCVTWRKNVDNWWTHHPTWEIKSTNETVQCFQPIQNADKAAFLQRVHDNQWNQDCKDLITSTQINSGYSASTNYLAYTFLRATIDQKPFQITRHNYPWIFGPQTKESWAYCKSEDITCFMLPLSNCERDFVTQQQLRDHVKNRQWKSPDKKNKTELLDFEWLKQYLLRPNQGMRRQMMLMRMSMNLTTPCTSMHVRRGDSGLPERPYRRYAAVQEYIDAADIEEGDTIFLLTDDQTTIDEINTYHQNYNWVYLNRTRHSGIDGGWQSHVPSGDGPFEVLAIEIESYLVRQCDKSVHGQSGFMGYILGQMRAEGKSPKAYFVNTRVSKQSSDKWLGDAKGRIKHFMEEMEEYRQKSFAKRKKKQLGGKEEGATEEPVDVTTSTDQGKEGGGPMTCTKESDKRECCFSWDFNVDVWWTHKPTWEVSKETETTQCFSRFNSTDKAEYFQRLYDTQWKGNCSRLVSATQINSGYGASTNWQAYTFMKASMDGNPFQPLRHDVPWKYGPTDKTSWAYCDSEDLSCFILPLSKCEREFLPKKKMRSYKRIEASPNRLDHQEKMKFEWLKEFMLRPTQAVRHQGLKLRNSMNLTTPCTTIHVRRGDSGMPIQPYRRYAAVQEYLDAAEVQEGDTVLLLTDDQTTIDEIHKYHQNYNWVYLNKTRPTGVDDGWESHVPSGDGPFEVVAIQTETYLASQCNKIVHGRSGFMKVVRGIMEAQGTEYKAYYVETSVTEAEAKKWPGDGKERVAHFQKEMEEYRKKSNERKKQKKGGGGN